MCPSIFYTLGVCVFIMREEPDLERNQLQRRNKIVATIISVNAR